MYLSVNDGMPVFNAFAPVGRSFTCAHIPMALPLAMRSLDFQPAYSNDGVSLQIPENPKEVRSSKYGVADFLW